MMSDDMKEAQLLLFDLGCRLFGVILMYAVIIYLGVFFYSVLAPEPWSILSAKKVAASTPFAIVLILLLPLILYMMNEKLEDDAKKAEQLHQEYVDATSTLQTLDDVDPLPEVR